MSTESRFATDDELIHNIPTPNTGPDTAPDTAAKSPDAIERNIDARRANIENLVDALESKLSPGQLIDQALTFTKENGGEFFGNLGTSIRNNPMPMLLTTVGISWLMLGQNQKPGAASGSSTGASMFGQLGEKLSGAAHSVSESFSSATDHARESAHQASDKAGQFGESASHTLDDLKHQASEKTAAMKDTLSSTAALGIALGAALGAALPSTEKENKAFGKASDDLTQKAKATVSETWETVSDAGKNMADDLKSTAKGV